MFWCKKPHSLSPPRLTSSIPEIEHHLATMDTPVSNPLEAVDAISTEDLSGSSTAEEARQAHSPTHKAPLPMTEEPLFEDNDAETSTTPKDTTPPKNTETPKRKRVISKTAKCSRPRILVLLTCVSYLLFHLMGADLGLQLIESYTKPRLHRAEAQAKTAALGLINDNHLKYQYDQLLGTTLDRHYMESYESCLARGLYKADKVFYSLDFTQSSEIRNQTMAWVTDNCDRLSYTPQVYNPSISRLWLAANNARKVTVEVFNLFKNKITLLRSRLLSINPRLVVEPVVMTANYTAVTYSRVPVGMPYGFATDCDGRSRCRLIYVGPTNPNTTREAFKDALREADREAKKWSWSAKLSNVLDINIYAIYLLLGLQALLAHIYVLADILSRPRLPPQRCSWVRVKALPSRLCHRLATLQGDELVFLGCFPNVVLYTLLHTQVKYIISEFDSPLLPVGCGCFVFHSVQMVAFFDPTSDGTEHLRGLYRSIKELYLIARGVEVPGLTISKPTPRRPSAPCNRTTACSTILNPASKITARFISPLTPISEDLKQELKAIHTEQGKRCRDDVEPQYGYATESESGYDSDEQHADYVDLAGGATPTVSEDEAGWSVVDE
jgi:hypothetical protein